MKKCHLLLVPSLLSIITTPVQAETFSYTAASITYEIISEEVDGVSDDFEGDGININVSAAITSNIALTAGYGSGSADITSGANTLDADIDAWGIGILYHRPINTITDFVAGLDYIQGDIDIKLNGSLFSSDDANGNSIYVGIRSMVANNIELNAYIDRADIESSTSTDIEFGGAYYIDKSVSLTVNYSFDSDGDSLEFGAIKYF